MHEFDDLQGRVRTLEQRGDGKHRIPELSNLPDHQSFDIEFGPSKLVILLVTRTHSGAVHHSKRFFYGDSGELKRTVRKDASGAETESNELSRETGGKRAWATRKIDGHLIASGIDEYVSGLLVCASSFRGEALSTRRTIEYVDRKPVQRMSEFYGFTGELAEKSITKFDIKGRIVETFGLKPDGRPLGDGKYVYEYDSAGRKHRVLSFDDIADENIPNRISGFTYVCDEEGNWIERREFSRGRSDDRWRVSVTERKLAYHS